MKDNRFNGIFLPPRNVPVKIGMKYFQSIIPYFALETSVLPRLPSGTETVLRRDWALYEVYWMEKRAGLI